MDPLPGATSLARTLLALSRARASGVLTVEGTRRRARVAVSSGTPRAVQLTPPDDVTLGDLLLHDGSLDTAAHARALAQGTPAVPVGRWLVRTGVATEPAVAHALRRQLRRRVAMLFHDPAPECRFAHGSATIAVEPLEEPLPAGELVMGALREAVSGTSLPRIRRELGDGALALTSLGESLVAEAALWPAEAAVAEALRRGVDTEAALAIGGGGSRALRFLWALKLVHAVGAPARDTRAYPLLLRKHRQLREQAGATDLLDLPPNAGPREARRALRRLAGTLHPDRFGPESPPELREVSSQVMTALVGAERDIRSRG